MTGSLLDSVRFVDREAAGRALERLQSSLPMDRALIELEPALARALGEVADPDRALVTFERFVERHEQSVSLLAELARRPRVVEILVTVFAGSQFLAEILLRHPDYWEELGALWRGGSGRVSWHAEPDALTSTTGDDWEALRRRQRRELLRIGASDLLGLADLPTVTTGLSRLAVTVVRSALEITATDHAQGEEETADGEELCVLAFGKLGGGELNYSSDIDLVFVTEQQAPLRWKRAQQIVEGLARPGAEGFLYRVDLRLRPWGRDGPLVSSRASYLEYLQHSARPSERQALLKARPIAGDLALGTRLLDQARPLILTGTPQELRRQVRGLKERIEQDLRRRGDEHLHVKAGPGSIRDVEFATQYLQLLHGREHPEVVVANTLEALSRLYDRGCLDADAFRVLVEGYVFLRTVEHYLQLMHYHQVHALPDDELALTSLARRLRFRGDAAGTRFRERYEQHTEAIRQVYQRLLQEPVERVPVPGPDDAERWELPGMPPAYAEAFSAEEIAQHLRLAKRLSADHLLELDAKPDAQGNHRVTIVGYEFLGELTTICGLLFASGFNIVAGRVFTSHQSTLGQISSPGRDSTPRFVPSLRRRRGVRPRHAREIIVDVFTVRAATEPGTEVWQRLRSDLEALLDRLDRGEREEVQGELAKRIALALPPPESERRTLYPIDVTVDNEHDPQHTVLRIEAPDTLGFLYELTNALALHGVSIKTMTVETSGRRVADTLWVTDQGGGKIVDQTRLQELRVATLLTKHFTHLLPRSPNPESALLHFREFLADLFRRPDWSSELASLERPEVLGNLARLLGVSDFLWTDFLRMQHANLFPVLSDAEALTVVPDRSTLRADLLRLLERTEDSTVARRTTLNRFKDREMFRIDMRRILGHAATFEEFSSELTTLGEVVFEAALELAMHELAPRFGHLQGGSVPLCICALGKFGGCELGFASDFEVMFLYEGEGTTSGGEHSIDLAEYCERLVEATCAGIAAVQEGIFEIDLRLRPYGAAGPLAVSLASFAEYFGDQGDAWWYERQALIKLRPVAGAAEVGRRVVGMRDGILYSGHTPDVSASRAMRERQLRHLVTPGTINVKYSPGGLVDLEYLVQLLQLRFAHRHPELRVTNTQEALLQLGELHLLDDADLGAALEAYRFLRRLIDALRMVRGHAKDLTVPPADSEEFAFLARRFGDRPVAKLRNDLEMHLAQIRELGERLLRDL